jgi:hypothetical protein
MKRGGRVSHGNSTLALVTDLIPVDGAVQHLNVLAAVSVHLKITVIHLIGHW